LVNEVIVDWQAESPWQVEKGAYDDAVRLWLTAAHQAETDEEFLRRACQDARGTTPTTVEVEYFKADKDPRKREKLLDSLLKDPAVAKKVGEGWKDRMLQRKINANDAELFLGQRRQALKAWHWVYRASAKPNRFDSLLDQLLGGKRTDEQILEGLSLAVLGRLPTESEKQLALANVSRQQDKRAAWREVLHTLAGTSEAKQHADELQRRTAKPVKK
jgi:hypothetical protein